MFAKVCSPTGLEDWKTACHWAVCGWGVVAWDWPFDKEIREVTCLFNFSSEQTVWCAGFGWNLIGIWTTYCIVCLFFLLLISHFLCYCVYRKLVWLLYHVISLRVQHLSGTKAIVVLWKRLDLVALKRCLSWGDSIRFPGFDLKTQRNELPDEPSWRKFRLNRDRFHQINPNHRNASLHSSASTPSNNVRNNQKINEKKRGGHLMQSASLFWPEAVSKILVPWLKIKKGIILPVIYWLPSGKLT